MATEYVMSRLIPHITKKILTELFNGKNNGNIKIMCNDITQAGVAEDCLLDNGCYWDNISTSTMKNKIMSATQGRKLIVVNTTNGRSEISLCYDYTEFALLKNKLVLL